MKILVTGADGFLGSNAVRYLKERGYNVTAYTQDVKYNMPYETYDVLYHFAAFVGGRKGIDNNLWNIAENIEIDRLTFKWAEQFCGKIIYPSSCAAYPAALQTQAGTPMSEDTPDGETFDMYGMSKLAAECMLKQMTIPSHVMRPFTIYGPGQSMDYPLPSIIARARQGECSVWGSGTQIRDYVYIDDACRVFEYLMHREEPIKLNIGSGIPTNFITIAEIIYEQIHGVRIPVQTMTNEPEGAGYRYSDTTLQASLGLMPEIGLAEGIRRMINA